MSVLKPLFSVVQSLLHEHEALTELSQRKKDILIKGDMEALNVIVQEEMQHVSHIERLEKERIGIGRLIALRVGVPMDELTASKMASFAESEQEAAEMEALTLRLQRVLGELKELNDLNKQLLDQSLQFVQMTIGLLTESPTVPTYGGSGESNAPYQTGRTSFFDSKA